MRLPGSRQNRAVSCPDFGVKPLLDDDYPIRPGNRISRRKRTGAGEWRVWNELLGDDVVVRVDDDDRPERPPR